MLAVPILLLAFAGSVPPCSCPDSIGASAGAEPLIFLSHSGQKGLVACGHLESRAATVVTASELDVFSCGSDEPILTFGALQRAELQREADAIVITETGWWPFGPDWTWLHVPIWRYVLEPGSPPRIAKTLILKPPRLSSQRTAQALALYERTLKVGEDAGSYEDVIGRLLAAALSGNARARTALARLGDASWVDGHTAETWQSAIDLYQLYARATGKVALLPDL